MTRYAVAALWAVILSVAYANGGWAGVGSTIFWGLVFVIGVPVVGALAIIGFILAIRCWEARKVGFDLGAKLTYAGLNQLHGQIGREYDATMRRRVAMGFAPEADALLKRERLLRSFMAACAKVMHGTAIEGMDLYGVFRRDHDPEHGTLYMFRKPSVHVKSSVSYGALLRVQCPSTREVHFLMVPPTMRTARQARAWTFGMKPDEFAPAKET